MKWSGFLFALIRFHLHHYRIFLPSLRLETQQRPYATSQKIDSSILSPRLLCLRAIVVFPGKHQVYTEESEKVVLIPIRLTRMKNTRRNKHTFKHFNKQRCEYPCDCHGTRSYMFIARSYIFPWKDNENCAREVYIALGNSLADFFFEFAIVSSGTLFSAGWKAEIGITEEELRSTRV